MSISTAETSIATPSHHVPAGRWIEGLSGDMPLADVLETIFRERWEGVLYYLSAVVENGPQEIEHVHKLRVSCRRLGAILDVLADAVPRAPRRKLARLADEIRQRCGEARDLDVQKRFLESLLPHASVEDAGAIEVLCEMTVNRRARLQKKLRRRLPRLTRKLRRAGIEMLKVLDVVRKKGRPVRSSFDEIGVRTLLNELAALWDKGAEDIESAETLHQLRIAGKHLRYAFEVFMPVLPESFREDFYPQLVHVQDLLGMIHDSAQATQSLRRRRKKWQRRWKEHRWDDGRLSAFEWDELRAGLDAVLLAYAQQSNHALTELLDVWPGFAGSSFRVPVEQVLTAMPVTPSPESRT